MENTSSLIQSKQFLCAILRTSRISLTILEFWQSPSGNESWNNLLREMCLYQSNLGNLVIKQNRIHIKIVRLEMKH